MPTFNPNNYFATKLDDATRSKVLDIQAASQAKIALLDAQGKQFAAQQEAERQAYEASWVGKLGLEPTGFVANRVNDVASLVSGASRVAGQLASLPSNIASAMDLSGITQEDTDAYNRYLAGKATPQDMSLLQSPKTTGKSVYQSIEDAKASQGTATAVADTFKLDKIVDPTNRNALAKDLGQDFEASWSKVTEGWDEGKKGNFLDSVSGIATGLGGLLANAGEAVVTNPNAVKEYVIENAPQLLIGAYGKAGQAALAASNVGYAFDNYRQGMENYAKAHGGQLPPEEERSRMATLATTLALAEQASDVFTLGLAKIGGKAAKTAEQLAQDASQSALKGIGKATLGGIASEAPTEGYQTWAEGEITGKPATAKDIYTGAVIGGAAGAGLTGGLRTLAEVTGTTEEKLAKREVDAKRADVIRTAVDTGNVDAFLDPKTKTYAPDQAIAALFGNSQKDGTTDEAKQQNLARAGQIVSDLEQQRTKASELLQASSPEAVVALKAELVKAQADGDTEYAGLLQAQIEDIEGNPKVAERLAAQVTDLDSKLAKAQEAFKLFNQESVKDVDVEAEVARIKANDDTSSGAADNVINLSMAAPERIDTTLAMELANDTTNGLSTTQRDYLRSFSEAQQVISDAKTIKGVSKDIFEGGEGFKGLPEYQKAISSYLAAGNKDAADRELSQLRDFLQTRTSKLKAAQAALDQATASGTPVQIVRADGAWSVNTGVPIDMKTTEPGSVLEISKNSVNLIRNLGIEAQAIRAVGKTMRAAYDLKTAPKAAQPQTQQTSQPRQQEQTNGTQATETQQAEAQGSQASESAGSTTAANTDEVTAPTQEETQTGKLTAVEQPGFVADHFTQSSKREGDTTARPLASVKNFLTAGFDKVMEFVPVETLSSKQDAVIQLFQKKATEWQQQIQKNLSRRKQEYWSEDLTQYLMQETDGKLDFEENTKTAISFAVFSWVAENSTLSQSNTDEEINAILERDENTPVSETERALLGNIGMRQNVVINALGERIVQSLGLKANRDTPRNLLPELQSQLGAHAWKLMMDLGLLERTSIPGSKMAEMMNSSETNASAAFHFLKLAQGPLTKEITDTSKGSQGILEKLFSVEPGLKEPSLEPIPFKQTTTKNTQQRVPEKLAKIIEHENSVANFVRQDMMQLITQLGDSVLLALAGFKPVTDQVHVTKRAGIQAKNDQVKRELERFMEFVQNMEDQEAALYFEHTVWKQQRVGIATNVINPQTSKLHRFMLYRKSWETQVAISDQAQMDNFKLRVLEGLGVKTDKQSNAKSLASFEQYVGTPEMQNAIEVLRKAVFEGGIDPNGEKALVAAIEQANEGFHSLDSLMALAHYAQAVKEGKDSFTVQMMGEVDGVTNGPMLSHLLLGAASTVKGLFSLLNRGGFYEQDNKDTQYNQWREKPGHLDLYETTALHMTQAVQRMLEAAPKVAVTLDAIYAFTGTLAEKDGSVAKAGRNIIKTPLTAMIFGSSTKSAVDSMANNFIDSIYSSIEDVAAGKADLKTVQDHVNTLLLMGKGPTIKRMSVDQLLNYTFFAEQVTALKRSFKDTLGKAVAETMESDFGEFIERRQALNTAAELSFELYNAVYTAMREKMVAELATDNKGQPVNDLTPAQEATLRKQVSALAPIMHTLMSKESGSLKAGLFASKTGRKISSSAPYRGNVQFANGIPGTKVWSQKQGKYIEQRSVTTAGYESSESAPGVAMVPMSVHSTDSAISHLAADGHEVLNIHDAHGSGLGTFQQTAQNLNQATWQAMLNYSPATEMADMLSRTVQGLAQVLQQEDVDPAVKQAVAKALETFAAKHEMSTEAAVGQVLTTVKEAAYLADDMRLQALAQMGSIDQYALEGGNHVVTAEERAAAESLRAGLVRQLSADEKAAVEAISQAVEMPVTESVAPEAKPTVSTVFGELGKPAIRSDADLVGFFESNPEATAEQVIALLAQPGRLNPVNRKLLQLASRIVGKDLPVRFITDPNQEVLEVPSVPSRGWYVSNASGEAIHVLGPQFKASGLTAETLLHELVHAALAKTIANPSAAAAELVAELETLRTKAKEYADANGLTQFAAALGSVQEFVAWGMTNQAFQRDVLTKIQMASKTKGNALVTAMQKFVETLSKLLFKKPSEEINNGLSVLISNVSGLAYEAAQGGQKETRLNLSQESNEAVDAYTTLDLFTALDNGTVEPRFQAHLSNLLAGMVEKLHGPFGAFRDAMRKTEAGNPLAVWLKAMETGEAPFASVIVASGFAGSAQEDFAMQQIEATIKAALDGSEATTKAVYRELYNLYTEMRQKLKPSDFASQEDYDFVFKIDAGNGGRSDYLARFAALGLGSQKFNKLLQVATEVTAPTEARTLVEKLTDLFQKVLNFFNEKITRVYQGQQADEKLLSLVNSLVDIEAKKRMSLLSTEQDLEKDAEAKIKASVDGIKSKISDLANSKLIKNSSSNMVKFGGVMVQIATKGVLDKYIDEIRKFYDVQTKEKHGIAMGLLSELVGPQEAYRELHRARKHQEQMRKSVISKTSKLVKSMFANNGKDLTDGAKTALTRVFLRTGMHNLLDQYSVQQMDVLLASKAGLQAEIDKLKATLPAHVAAAYLEQINALGYYNATGKSRTQVLMLNAHLIARMAGTKYQGQITEQQANQVQQTIATLVTLFSVKYAQDTDKAAALQLLRTENNRTDGKNGVEFMLALHKQMEQESEAKLFKESPALMVHGYTPEITNPHTSFEVATEEEGRLLLEQGYVKGAEVKNDSVDPSPTKHIYVMRDGGLAPWLSGIMSVTDLHTKGSAQNIDIPGLTAAQTRSSITADKLSKMDQRKNPERDLNNETGNNLVPVFNANGDIVDWRYMMADATKDTLLERDNSFDSILGALAGSVYDKETASEVNERMVTALREQFEAEYALQKDSYMEVSASSSDPEIQEMWRLLPESTKKTIRKVWGRDSMMVRKDVLDITFGYRKYSLAEAFRKDQSMRNDFERLTLNTLEAVLVASGRTPEQAQNHIKRIGARVAKGERIWQEIVKEIKDIVVVKNVTTLVGNIYSNLSLLSIKGVSWKDMIHHHTVAIKGALAYERDTARLFDLEKQLESGVMGAAEAELRHEIARLKDLIARNPVKELMDAGLMPTIVEDIENEDDIYSYKSAFSQKAERFVSRLPTPIKEAGKFVYMTHDTKMYQFLSHTTQLSDFVARYTLYQHLISRKDNPLSKQDAIRDADESFINYDIALPRKVQYLDDLGILPFTKYFLRIQRVLVKSFRENPARVLSLALLNNFMNLGPIVLDSSFIHHIGNMPLYGGALRFPQTLDELATVKAAMALVK